MQANKLYTGGFTYLGVLFLLMFMGLGMAKVAELWALQMKREREQELLFAGAAYRRAIQSFYQNTPSGVPQYPARLSDLLEDPRTPAVKRHLRRLYVDPMTGKADWVEIKSASGKVIGVHSSSTEAPLKTGNFSWPNRFLADKSSYSEWRFVVEMQAAAASQVVAVPNEVSKQDSGTAAVSK